MEPQQMLSDMVQPVQAWPKTAEQEAERQIHLQLWHLCISKKVTHTLQYTVREDTKLHLCFPFVSVAMLDLCCLLADLRNTN